MLTVEMLVGGTFTIVAAVTALKPHIGGPLGCMSPLLAFVATIVVISLWPSGSSTDALEVIWVPFWVSCGALPGVIVGIGLRALRGKPL